MQIVLMQKIWLILLICMFTVANIPKDSKVSEETKSDTDSNETSNSISTTVSRKKKRVVQNLIQVVLRMKIQAMIIIQVKGNKMKHN